LRSVFYHCIANFCRYGGDFFHIFVIYFSA
jgi:hypothetical protein